MVPPRTGAGKIWCLRSVFWIGVCDILNPNLSSSPSILPYPQRGFSFARRRIRLSSSWLISGLPLLFLRSYVHFRRTSSRCQRRTVSGWKIRMMLRNLDVVCTFISFNLTTRTLRIILSTWSGLTIWSCFRWRILNFKTSTEPNSQSPTRKTAAPTSRHPQLIVEYYVP